VPNVQWNDIPFQMQSFRGNLDLNPFLSGTTGPQWILQPEKCQAGSAKRVARDNSPQKGGEIVHRHFKAGLVMQLGMLGVNVIATDTDGGATILPACGSDLVDLFDNLLLVLNAMENSDGRMIWTPTGHATRLMDAARWLGSDGQAGGAFTSVVTTPESDVFTAAEFALLSPLPYAMDYTQIVTNLTSGVPAVLDNTGNTDFFPVIHVFGPTSLFTITNITNSLSLTYDASLPGASSVGGAQAIEFDFFRETAYFGPTLGPWTGANAKPGIDVLASDFWPLTPGNNIVEITGANATVLWQAAYTG